MPKSREAKGNNETPCSFCGQAKEQVPLMIASSVTKACVCSWCALGVIEQTFKHAMGMENVIRKMVGDPSKADPETPKPNIEIVPAGTKPDALDVQIGKQLHGK